MAEPRLSGPSLQLAAVPWPAAWVASLPPKQHGSQSEAPLCGCRPSFEGGAPRTAASGTTLRRAAGVAAGAAVLAVQPWARRRGRLESWRLPRDVSRKQVQRADPQQLVPQAPLVLAPSTPDRYLVFQTDCGDVRLLLRPDCAPETVAHISADSAKGRPQMLLLLSVRLCAGLGIVVATSRGRGGASAQPTPRPRGERDACRQLSLECPWHLRHRARPGRQREFGRVHKLGGQQPPRHDVLRFLRLRRGRRQRQFRSH
mmetsp:Transcript_159279/g.511032  ORF Transcript_159279/g.511032 Transcript_159279/m.511032 type:complete len:258 (-) Transcript_159279:289-1062(-)